MYGMLLEGLEPSYLDETPMLFIKLQERWGGVWVGGWRYFDGDNLGGADGTFACKRTIFGVLRNGGLSCLIRSIETLDPKALML